MTQEAAKTVLRFNFWYHPVNAATFDAATDMDLATLDLDAEDAVNDAAFATAHGYQISAAKDELPRRWFADAALLVRAPELLVVSSVGAGYDTTDVAACTKRGVLVVNQAGANAQSVAEHTLGLMLDLMKRLSESDRRLRSGRGYAREDLMGRELAGKTLGLVGIGHVGSRVARLARAFDMAVLASDPYLDADEIARRGAAKVAFDDLLARADVVSLHCPRDASTLGLMNARAFATMKLGAVFVSTARGGIHDERALLGALAAGHLSGAGLDVWDDEPPPLDHPLLRRDDVVATYHTAGVTHEARASMGRWAAEQVIDTLRGRRPPRLVNPEAWPRFLERYVARFGAPAERVEPASR